MNTSKSGPKKLTFIDLEWTPIVGVAHTRKYSRAPNIIKKNSCRLELSR